MTNQEAEFLKRWFDVKQGDNYGLDITILPLEELTPSFWSAAINKGASPLRLGQERYLVRTIPERDPKTQALVRENYEWVREHPNIPVRRQYTFKDGKVLTVCELQGWGS